jgi:hypothetical protein
MGFRSAGLRDICDHFARSRIADGVSLSAFVPSAIDVMLFAKQIHAASFID